MYYLLAFLSGMSIMILELASIEITGSFLNNTHIVYTSIIGVIMASLSIGYFAGGKLSNYKPSGFKLSSFFIFSALYLLILSVSHFSFFKFVVLLNISDINKALLASAVMFAIPSILLGIISPYIIQVVLNEQKKYQIAGLVSGKYSAISTIGSILGTFLCGFYLISKFEISTVFAFLSFLLFICAITSCFFDMKVNTKNDLRHKTLLLFYIGLTLACGFCLLLI